MTPISETYVDRHSRPSELEITDMRLVNLVGLPMHCTLLRIDTNQGLSGYGEVRDGASKTYTLMLKSRIVGENPCNVDKVFRKIKQFGYHGRQAGGVCGVEMALMDLAGKAYGVPAYQLAGGKFRDRVLCYCDTPTVPDGRQMGKSLKRRIEQGFRFLKLVLENHSVDTPAWNEIVVGLPNPIIRDGYVQVPETPGLGFSGLNEEAVMRHIDPRQPGYFSPTEEWDEERSHDRLWS